MAARSEGPEQRPWFNAVEVFSGCDSVTMNGNPHDRERHFFSQNEASCLLGLLWSDIVVDIREQYRLMPLSGTLRIGRRLGVKHPSRRRKPTVMTTTESLR